MDDRVRLHVTSATLIWVLIIYGCAATAGAKVIRRDRGHIPISADACPLIVDFVSKCLQEPNLTTTWTTKGTVESSDDKSTYSVNVAFRWLKSAGWQSDPEEPKKTSQPAIKRSQEQQRQSRVKMRGESKGAKRSKGLTAEVITEFVKFAEALKEIYDGGRETYPNIIRGEDQDADVVLVILVCKKL